MQAGLFAKKVGMTQIFDESGTILPVTILKTGLCQVSQIKTVTTDGYNAVQIAYGEEKLENINTEYNNQDSKTNVALLNQKKLNKQLADKNSQFKNCSFDKTSVNIDELEFSKTNLKERLVVSTDNRDTESDRKKQLVNKP